MIFETKRIMFQTSIFSKNWWVFHIMTFPRPILPAKPAKKLRPLGWSYMFVVTGDRLDLLPLPTQEASHKWRFIVYRCLYRDSLLTRNIPGGDWYGRWGIRVSDTCWKGFFKKNWKLLIHKGSQSHMTSPIIFDHFNRANDPSYPVMGSRNDQTRYLNTVVSKVAPTIYCTFLIPNELKWLGYGKTWKLVGRCTIPFTETLILEKEGLPFQILVEWMHLPPFFCLSFFQSIFPQLFLLLRGKDKKRSLLKGFWYGFWSRVWLSCPIAFCGNRWFQFLRTHSLFGKSLAFLVSAAILYCFNIKFEEYPLVYHHSSVSLLRYTLVLWPLSTSTPFFWEKKSDALLPCQKKTINLNLKLFKPRHWDTKGPKWPHCFAMGGP